jgi:hypothetical protein
MDSVGSLQCGISIWPKPAVPLLADRGTTGERENSCREHPMRAALTRMRWVSGRSTFEFEGDRARPQSSLPGPPVPMQKAIFCDRHHRFAGEVA